LLILQLRKVLTFTLKSLMLLFLKRASSLWALHSTI
jgi:hypothetical protein